MLKTILSISGKPGLYKLISQGKNMLIVESVSAEKKRFPAYGNEKIISLADIQMMLKFLYVMFLNRSRKKRMRELLLLTLRRLLRRNCVLI